MKLSKQMLCLLASVMLCAPATARTLEQIKELGSILLCANPEALPYASDKSDKPGFQIEVAREIANDLGVKLSIEWVVPRRRANVVNCDLQLDVPSDVEKQKKGKHRQTRAYHKAGVVLGLSAAATPIQRYTELQPGQRVGVMIGSVASEVLGKAGVSIVPYAFQSDMVDDLSKGELHGAAVSGASLSYYVLQHPESGIKVIQAFDEGTELVWPVAAGLRNADDAIVEAVNRIIERMLADGTIKRIYGAYGIAYQQP